MPPRPDFVVHFSKPKLLLQLLVSSFFAALGVYLILLASGAVPLSNTFKVDPIYLASGGIGFIAAVVAIGPMYVRQLLSKSPGLVLSKSGFHDNVSSQSFGFIPWTEVSEIHHRPFGLGKMVVFKLKNPNPYLGKFSWIRKYSVRKATDLMGGEVQLSAISLKISGSELYEVVQRYADRE